MAWFGGIRTAVGEKPQGFPDRYLRYSSSGRKAETLCSAQARKV